VKPVSIVSEGTAKINECGKNYSCGKVIYMGDIQGPERMNDTCMQRQWKMVSLYIIYTAENMNNMKHNLWTEKHDTFL
jgi:hypothetical protein